MREKLRARLRDEAGLDPPEWLLASRLEARAALAGVPVDEYAVVALGDDTAGRAERARLIELLRVGETRLFRHADQIALIGELLPELVAATGGRKLTLWSAGCATGEEAWTLALLAERLGGDWEVVGTDISDAALEVARRGSYDSARAAELPSWAQRMVSNAGGVLRFDDALKARVRFFKHNLLDAPPSTFDLVLCRNVLIYFDAERRAIALGRLYDALRPTGGLLVGYSESLRDQPRFNADRRREVVCWRRAEGATPPERPRRITQPIDMPARIATVAPRQTSLDVGGPPRARTPSSPALAPVPPAPSRPLVALNGRYDDDAAAARISDALRPHLGQPVVLDLDGATLLGDAAARVLRRALSTGYVALRATRPPVRRWLERQGLTDKGER